jgi:hypothetical protein
MKRPVLLSLMAILLLATVTNATELDELLNLDR